MWRLLIIVLFTSPTFAQQKSDSVVFYPIERLEEVYTQHPGKIIRHYGFCLNYSEHYEQAAWVAYCLTKEKTIKQVERQSRFKQDPKIKTATATDADYYQSGYDRGHLAPAADMAWSDTSMRESFYYSNVSPQVPAFNRGIWKTLEEQVRDWANEFGTIYITTGPVFTNAMATIGPNKVAVPDAFYKVILVYQDTVKKGIGFILPNQASKKSIFEFAVPIDSVESVTKLDFFYQIPDSVEAVIEAKCELLQIKNVTTTVVPQNNTQSTQCVAISKSTGKRCRNMTKKANGRCHVHQ